MEGSRPIILIDDDPDDLQFMTDAFKKFNCNYPILKFSRGLELIDFLEAQPDVRPALIISDSFLPGMDGEEIVQNIRNFESGKDAPIVFFTSASITTESKRRASILGVKDFYVKPMSMVEFVDTLRSIFLKYVE